MNRDIKTFLIIVIILLGIVGIGYYSLLLHVDFIGNKDPKVVEENIKRWNNTILSAEYRDGTDFCNVLLLDSINIEINVGDKSGGTILNQEYKISKDTIVVIGGTEHAKKYLKSDKFVIHNDKLLFKVDNSGSFDTTTVMTIEFNKLKL